MVEFAITELKPQAAMVVHGQVSVESLPEFFGRAFGEVMAMLQRSGCEPVGAPFGYYPSAPGETVDLCAGFPVAQPLPADGDVVSLELPGGRVVTGVHVGPYDTLEQTYNEIMGWMKAEGVMPAGSMWECYLTDPASAPPDEWRTEIVWPIV